MKLLWNEFIKVFCKRSMLLLILGLLLLNGVLLYINEGNAAHYERYYSDEAYKHIFEDVEKLTKEDALESLQKQFQKLQYFYSLSQSQENEITMQANPAEAVEDKADIAAWIEEYNKGDYLVYTNSLWRELNLYSDVLVEVENCVNYPEYLQNIKDTAQKLQEVSIFSNPAAFSYKNIIKTAKAFTHLQNREITPGPSCGVKMFGEFIGTDLLAVLFIVIVVISLITREKEQAQFILLRSTYRGRGRLIILKLMTAYIGCILTVVFLYVMNYIIALNTYGFGDMDRAIQSVLGYTGSNLSITIKQYLLFFLLSKILIYMLIATIIFFIAVYAKDTIQLYVVIVAVALISGVLYNIIPTSSYLSFFKFINLFGFLHTWQLFGEYLNINIFTVPVSYLPLFYLSAVLCGILFSALSVYYYCRQYSIRTGSKSYLWSRLGCRLKKVIYPKYTVSIFLHECYKIFIAGKVLLLLLIFFGAIFITYKPIKENFRDINGAYYKQYMLKLEGSINEEKLTFIREEEKKFTDLSEEYQSKLSQNDNNFYVSMEYQDLLAPRDAFEEVKVHSEYLESQKKGQFLYDTGYKLLTGDTIAGKQDILLAIIAVVMIIACLTYVYSIEYQSGVSVLMKTSLRGRGETFVHKLIISVLVITLVFIGTYLPVFHNVFHAYGVRAVHAPANSMEILSGLPDFITIQGYLVMISVMRYLGLLLAVLVIFHISTKLKSYILALLACTGVLVLPLLVALIGVPGFQYVLLNPLLIGNIFS